jgi:hypothetical protein
MRNNYYKALIPQYNVELGKKLKEVEAEDLTITELSLEEIFLECLEN